MTISSALKRYMKDPTLAGQVAHLNTDVWALIEAAYQEGWRARGEADDEALRRELEAEQPAEEDGA